jgi:hypothetical protein
MEGDSVYGHLEETRAQLEKELGEDVCHNDPLFCVLVLVSFCGFSSRFLLELTRKLFRTGYQLIREIEAREVPLYYHH